MAMNNLPKSYVNVVRDITGHWGTYPPSIKLEPGMVGRAVNGVFVEEGNLSQFAGFDPTIHAVNEKANDDTESRWATSSVRIEMLGAKSKVSAIPTRLRMKVQFGRASEALIVCKGAKFESFANLEAVKELMRTLRENDEWDRELCVVTHVFAVKSALIFFSTDKGQSAEVEASGAFTLAFEPLAVLQASANASLVASSKSEQFAGFFTALPSGGTPLFMAIRFNHAWWSLSKDTLGYLKGSGEFEEPPFGECESK
jgi:hypothetical protein